MFVLSLCVCVLSSVVFVSLSVSFVLGSFSSVCLRVCVVLCAVAFAPPSHFVCLCFVFVSSPVGPVCLSGCPSVCLFGVGLLSPVCLSLCVFCCSALGLVCGCVSLRPALHFLIY